jgi:hypothetical protein
MCAPVLQQQVWDPGLIVAQIVSVQCLFYLALGLLQAALLGAWRAQRVCVADVTG